MASEAPAPVPFHAEAFPRIDLRAAWKAVQAGRNAVVWYDETGTLVGLGKLGFPDDEQLIIDVHLREIGYLEDERHLYRLDCSIKERDGRRDVTVSCPGCSRQIQVITLKDNRWACNYCQRLTYRSKIIGRSVRHAERLSEINATLAFGRPAGMRADRYVALCEEQQWLTMMLGERSISPAAHHDHVLTTSFEMPPPAICVPASGSRQAMPGNAVLEVVGDCLLEGGGHSLPSVSDIRSEVAAAYRAEAAAKRRPSRLGVRRAVLAGYTVAVPLLAPMPEIAVARSRARTLKAHMTIRVTGDVELFTRGLQPLAPPCLPIGRLEDGQLVLEVRFTDAEAPFVGHALRREYNRVVECLASLAKVLAHREAQVTARVKEIVDAEWAQLTDR